MKKHILTTIFLVASFCTSGIYSQCTSSIDLSIGVGHSYRTLSNQSGDEIVDMLISGRNSNEEVKSQWNATIGYSRSLSEKWILSTGLKYSNYSYYISKNTDLRWPSQHDGTGGFDPTIEVEGPYNALYTYELNHFVGVPIALRYQLSKGKIMPYFQFGITSNYHLSSKDYFSADSNIIRETSNDVTSKFNIFGDLALGANYTITNSTEVFGQVHYSHQVNATQYGELGQRLLAYGINFGVRRSLCSNSGIVTQ